jgi:hypothetical protein
LFITAFIDIDWRLERVLVFYKTECFMLLLLCWSCCWGAPSHSVVFGFVAYYSRLVLDETKLLLLVLLLSGALVLGLGK